MYAMKKLDFFLFSFLVKKIYISVQGVDKTMLTRTQKCVYLSLIWIFKILARFSDFGIFIKFNGILYVISWLIFWNFQMIRICVATFKWRVHLTYTRATVVWLHRLLPHILTSKYITERTKTTIVNFVTVFSVFLLRYGAMLR